MGLLDSIIGAAANSMLGGGQARSGGITGNPMVDLIIGMLSNGGQGGGGMGGGLGSVLGGLVGGGQPAGGMGGGLGGGLGGLLQMIQGFQNAGLGQQVQSWVGTGANMPVSPDQLQQVFGQSGIDQIAQTLGISPSEASGQLAQWLPQVIDRMTPQGQVPQDLNQVGGLDSLVSGLNGLLGGR